MTDNVFPALVSEKHRLQFSEGIRREMDELLWRLSGQHVEVEIRKESQALSARQRRFYFGVILKRIHQKTGQPIDDLHLYFKGRLLGNPHSRVIVLVDANGEVRDEREVYDDPSITVLSTRKMSRYSDDIRMIAAAELGIDIPDPDPTRRTR